MEKNFKAYQNGETFVLLKETQLFPLRKDHRKKFKFLNSLQFYCGSSASSQNSTINNDIPKPF